MDQNRARAACKEKIGGCMSGCAGKREQKGVRDCRGGLIGVSVRASGLGGAPPKVLGRGLGRVARLGCGRRRRCTFFLLFYSFY